MSWLMRLLDTTTPGRIGPGRLVLVVGPSGAGKDTLIDCVRAACRDRTDILFPRRVITRPSTAAEDHDTVTEAAFEHAASEGAFAIWWSAHRLKYGIPIAIDAGLQAGRTVVCNVSRTVVQAARARYAHVAVVLVTAPPEVLSARLSGRARGSDGNVADRIGRTVVAELNPDVTIDNIGAVEQAARRLLNVVSGQELVLGL